MEFCSHHIVVLLVISFFLCDNVASNTATCDDVVRVEIIPKNALVALSKHSDDGIPEYIVNKEITAFRISCSKTKDPVLWKVKLATAYTKSSVETQTEAFQLEKSNELLPRVCHTSSIEIKDVGENITGLYTCADLSSNSMPTATMFIYGGNDGDSSEASKIVNRGQQLQLDLQDHTFDMETPLKLPCTTHTPANITVALNKLPGKQFKNVSGINLTDLVQMPSRRCGESLCVDVNRLANLSRQSIGKGLQLMCREGNKNYVRDIVLIKILLPDFKFQPVEESKIMHIPIGQKLRFVCTSEFPVRMTTNYTLGHTISTKKEYLNRKDSYGSTLELTYGHPSWVDKWNTMHTSISCERTDRMQFVYSWNYTFVKTTINNETYNDFESQVKLLSIGKCATLDTSLASVYIVPCSTYTECKMKAPLLYVNNADYKVQTTNNSENIVEFAFPVNEKSFMVRCVSFQTDVMTIIYTEAEKGSSKRGVLTTVTPTSTKYPLISAKFTEKDFILGDIIHLNCKAPVMLFASSSYWTVTYRNESEFIIQKEYFLYEKKTIVDGMSTFKIAIRLASTDVVSLNCINYQFTSVQPFVWQQGLFIGNENVTVKERKYSFKLNVKDNPKPAENTVIKDDNKQTTVVAVLGGIFTLSAIITSAFLLRTYIKHKIANQLQEEELKYFLNGRPELISDKANANSNAQHRAYNSSYEIESKDLEIDYQTCLGSGEFGVVFKALFKKDNPVTVAVKSIKPGAGASYLRSAMAELKVMLYVQSHQNIIKVIGACTKNLINHELFVVMEYSNNGSLLLYLQRNSENFVNQVKNGNLEFDQTIFREDNFMATTDLIKWASQIATGMEYISSLNVIHGDLAARNVLLDSELNIKISDFGLSKKMYEFSQYVRKNSSPVPWRWLAVESLNFTEFSCSSDIWAFGVTLWEIFSLGAVPYPGQEFNMEFIKMLTNGYRLPLPEFSTFEIYNIILQCWRKNPHERPKFDILHSQFATMVDNINAHLKSNVYDTKKKTLENKQKECEYTELNASPSNNGYVTFNMLDYIDVNTF